MPEKMGYGKKGGGKGIFSGSMRNANGGDYTKAPARPKYSGEDGKGGHPSTAKAPTKCEEIKRG